jgi:predicted nuclease of predicted toxin-antitoxin system
VRFKRPVLKWALDEGVPDSVGAMLRSSHHKVILLNKTIPRGSTDEFVCDYAQINEAILVALDGDMRQIAKDIGVGKSKFKKLSLVKLSCREPAAARRMKEALSLIEHEWHVSSSSDGRRIFIDISDGVIRSHR